MYNLNKNLCVFLIYLVRDTISVCVILTRDTEEVDVRQWTHIYIAFSERYDLVTDTTTNVWNRNELF